MVKRYAGRMLVLSVAIIFCGLCNWIWKKVLSLSHLLDKIQDIGEDGFVYNSAESWLGLLSSGSQTALAHKVTLYIIILLQIICGITGIIFAVVRFAKRDLGKANIIPFVLGVIMCIVGAVSLVLLFVSSAAAVLTEVFLCITLFIVPVIFTVYSHKFYKGQ